MKKARRTRQPVHSGRPLLIAEVDVLRHHGDMAVIASGTSPEGDQWTLMTRRDDQDSLTALEVRTPTGHHSKGGYGSPPVCEGMRLETYTGHDDVGPDQIILRVLNDVAAVTVTLSDGRREHIRLFGDPHHPGVRLAALVYPRNLDIHSIDLCDFAGNPLPHDA